MKQKAEITKDLIPSMKSRSNSAVSLMLPWSFFSMVCKTHSKAGSGMYGMSSSINAILQVFGVNERFELSYHFQMNWNCIVLYWVVLSCIELYWVVLSCIELYWNCIQLYWICIDIYIDLYWVVLSCIELYWPVLTCIVFLFHP